jgi:FMN phosphatase YigB (HAD superfamily)
MILLFDLDDTLLKNDIDTFVPVYLKALGKHLSQFVAPEVLVPCLLAATKMMLVNNDPAISLETAFDQAFYPEIGQSKAALRPAIEQFYDEIYPGLHHLTSQRLETPGLVAESIALGHQVVVATNPLFPRKAIEHRLRWAGLDPDVVPFSLVTTYEGMHFAKPNPAYLAEILAQLGCPNQPAVMIGNSLSDDLTPANQLGMPVFWVNPEGAPLPPGFHPASASGSLDQVSGWIKQLADAESRGEISAPATLLAILKATPAAFGTLQKGLTPAQWKQRPAADEWSLTEIFCHIRDVDREVNIPRFEKIIQETNPFIPGIDTDPWAVERDYRQKDGPAALREFIAVRSQMVKMLEALSPEDWSRPARHAIFGPTDLAELVSFVTTHDRSHIQQVFATIRRTQ